MYPGVLDVSTDKVSDWKVRIVDSNGVILLFCVLSVWRGSNYKFLNVRPSIDGKNGS